MIIFGRTADLKVTNRQPILCPLFRGFRPWSDVMEDMLAAICSNSVAGLARMTISDCSVSNKQLKWVFLNVIPNS